MLDVAQGGWKILFQEARAIDWAILIVDFLVLAVILWLDAPERFHRRTVRKRLLMVQKFMADGQQLERTAPVAAGDVDAGVAATWVQSVQTWIHQTHQSLTKHSVQAGMSFVHRKVSADIRYGGITGHSNARDWYRELLHHLDNLRNIMEKADVYF